MRLSALLLSLMLLLAAPLRAQDSSSTFSHSGDHLKQAPAKNVDIITPHITDSHVVELPGFEWHLPQWKPIHIGGVEIDMSPTKHVIFLLLAAALCIGVMIPAAASNQRQTAHEGHAKGFAGAIESIVLYIRNEVILPNVGHHGNAYVPFGLTLFFFILFANLLGLLPYGSTATGNISVTATLALITFVVIEAAGIKALGPAYLKTIIYWPSDQPLAMKLPMTLIMTPVEIIGKFTKPFALAIRLFVMGVAISMLEIFVAFLQAFIFTLLASVFIGLIREGAH